MANKAEIAEFLAGQYPYTHCTVEAVGGKSATVKRQVGPEELRPGGTVSGPVLMTVADVALYVAIFGEIGIVPQGLVNKASIMIRMPLASMMIPSFWVWKMPSLVSPKRVRASSTWLHFSPGWQALMTISAV